MIRFAIGLGLALLTWYVVLRRGASAKSWRRVHAIALMLDIAPILLGFVIGVVVLARPLLSGLAITGLIVGLSLADRVKRLTLLEPVVFADRAELFEVIRHPGLYLPFVGSTAMLAGGGGLIAVVLLILAWLEPPLWERSSIMMIMEATAALLLGYGAFRITSLRAGLVTSVANFYMARLKPTRDPSMDAAAYGPLATFVVHATLAASERPVRQASAHTRRQATPIPRHGGPIIMVQGESFMDPARLHTDLARCFPSFATPAWQRGLLGVPAWGANTVRTEFAALTGIPPEALGLDRYNPYESFVSAGMELGSLALEARAAGYRTVFVHPFDMRFYGRSRVMPRLGFDELVGPSAFAQATRRGAYVSDEAVAAVIDNVLSRSGPNIFVFAATMEAHGPWAEDGYGDKTMTLPASLRTIPEAGAMSRWLWHLQGTDRMLGRLQQTLANVGVGWLVFYGDHQPSFPQAFAAAGLADRATDYAIWHAQVALDRREDIAAHDLGVTLSQAMQIGHRKLTGVPAAALVTVGGDRGRPA